jgi:hypothetical protein
MKTAFHPKPQAALDRQRSVPQEFPSHPRSKRILGVLLPALLTVVGLWSGSAQVNFTRVTEGDVATDIGLSWGVAWVNDSGRGTGAAWVDYDNDGLLDLFVGNALGPNFLYRNQGDGTMAEILGSPVSISSGGVTRGLTWADYDNDGYLDLMVTGMGEGGNRLFRNDGAGGFIRTTDGVMASSVANSISGAWGDCDHDGYLDLFIANLGPSECRAFLR